MKKIVVLTGAGMSVESGLSTFRDADGLWENYPVSRVATHEGWEADPEYVNNFYNMLRKKLVAAKPNEGHRLVASLEENYDVTVVTQNVDNLHEMAGSSKVIHLHGELMKVCSSRDVDNPRFQRTLSAPNLDVRRLRRLTFSSSSVRRSWFTLQLDSCNTSDAMFLSFSSTPIPWLVPAAAASVIFRKEPARE